MDVLGQQREAVAMLKSRACNSAYAACPAFESWNPNALPIIAGAKADSLW